MTSPTSPTRAARPIRVAVVALDAHDPAVDVAPVVSQVLAAAPDADVRVLAPVPVERGIRVPVPAWADVVPGTDASRPRDALQRLVHENLGAVGRLVAGRRRRELLRRADVVVAADRRSELLVWSLRRATDAALVTPGQALAHALRSQR